MGLSRHNRISFPMTDLQTRVGDGLLQLDTRTLSLIRCSNRFVAN